jgi:hypothetical protein
MRKTRFALILTGFIGLLLLGGCVSFEESIQIEEDGSGMLRFAYGVETSAYSQFDLALPQEYQLDSLFSTLIQDENITNVRQQDFEENGINWQSIEIDIADFMAVFAEERRFGPIIMSFDEQDGIYHFEQTVDLNMANVSIPGMYLLDIADAGYNVQLITPQITRTNGIQRDAGTSEWSISLPDLVGGDESIYLEADYLLEPYEGYFIPWELYFPYVVFGFLGLSVVSILVIIIVNTSKRVEKDPKLRF